jgi:hypothetical protein
MPNPRETAKARFYIVTGMIALGFLTPLGVSSTRAEPYEDVGDRFSIDPSSVLDDADQQWISQRNYTLKDPKAVTVLSMHLRATDSNGDKSICETGLEIQFFEDSECRGKFCRMVIKCGSATAPGRLNLMFMSRKNIEIPSWNFGPQIFDHCLRQAIRASTPFGAVLVVIGRNGLELGDPNSGEPGCDRMKF